MEIFVSIGTAPFYFCSLAVFNLSIRRPSTIPKDPKGDRIAYSAANSRIWENNEMRADAAI
jgi:hypothetical protein